MSQTSTEQGIKTMGVVGAGQMGAGIAQVAAAAGLSVVVTDVADAALERGRKAIGDSLARLVKKEALTQAAADAALARLSWSTDARAHAACDFVVEAATENEALKRKIFIELDGVCRPEVLLASNTSSISITRLAAATKRPERFIGMHFMNPVPLMKLVELIRGIATTDETYAATKALAEQLGKTTTVSKDYPGFIANRILMPMINEAFYALMEGVGSAEDIDTTMKLGTNQPMGPLTLADFIGLDTCLAILRVLHDGLGDSKYRPCPLLVQYVDAGWHGKKAGRGVYRYG
ncbi:MAG: 3-hydroxybutyryl-CoA dehydrogenase [Deltaproteobacteria bacterium]|nr:3-hydroxybutyryl-CoA dehydrogenase [Deltaproteobacteria bacterium]